MRLIRTAVLALGVFAAACGSNPSTPTGTTTTTTTTTTAPVTCSLAEQNLSFDGTLYHILWKYSFSGVSYATFTGSLNQAEWVTLRSSPGFVTSTHNQLQMTDHIASVTLTAGTCVKTVKP